jgi:hypothetical protein
MALATSQQINAIYQKHHASEVTFTRQVMQVTGLDPSRTYLRLPGAQVPCIVYSSTMEGGRVIVSLTPETRERLREAGNAASLRFCFVKPGEESPLFFFAPARISSLQPYRGGSGPTTFVLLTYVNRPPDDLILILGELLETQRASEKRRDERIAVTREAAERLGLADRSVQMLAGGMERQGILQDLSLGGALLVTGSEPRLAVGSVASLRLRFSGVEQAIELLASVTRCEEVPRRTDLVVVALQFDPATVPLAYKLRLAQYLKSSPQA